MNKNKIAAFVAGTALAALAGCAETTTTNSNANGNTVPSNTAVVTNNNGNTNTAGVTTTNTTTTTTRNYNANITRAEYDKDKDRYSREAKEAGNTIGQGANDGWLWTKTRAALLTTDDLRESTINVDVENDVVTLKGSVANAAQKAKAETVAKGIEGVKSVKNQLTVAAAGATTNTNANHNANATHNANKK